MITKNINFYGKTANKIRSLKDNTNLFGYKLIMRSIFYKCYPEQNVKQNKNDKNCE